MIRQKSLIPILTTSAVWLALVAGSLFLVQSRVKIIDPDSQVKIIKTVKSLDVGHVITADDLTTEYVDVSEVVGDAITDEKDLVDKRVLTKIQENEQIVPDRLIEKSVGFDKSFVLHTIPVTAETVNANAIQRFDTVNICVKYDDGRPTAVVIPGIQVYSLRVSDGSEVQPGNKTVPAFANFLVSVENQAILDDASKQGTLYLSKYLATQEEQQVSTYEPSWK